MQDPAARGPEPSAAALDALATGMDLGVLLIDSSNHPSFVNHAAQALLGCNGAAGLARAWSVLQGAMRPGPELPGARAFTAEIPAEGETRSLRGEIRDRDGRVEVFLKDRRRLGALDLELLCASRMKEWTHQCEALVHDANGALNTVQLTLELLEGQWPGPRAGEQVQEPHRRNHIGVMRDNLGKLKQILRRLGDTEVAAAGEVFELQDVIREAMAILRMPARRKRIELYAADAGAVYKVRANRGHVRQALVNVALARLETAPERSRFQIEAGSGREGTASILCSDAWAFDDRQRAGIFRVLLCDPEADGLRLARAIIEAEGAEFEVGANTPVGAVFRFVFPAA